MTFNLRRDVEADGELRWARRRDRVASLVRAQAPHVVATQEALPHQLADLDAALPGWRRVGRARSQDDEACAIYCDASRVELLAAGDRWLSDTPDEPGSRSWGNRLPRLVTWAALRDVATGRVVEVANTHLDHESARARSLSAAFLARHFPRAVLLGDFNEAPGGPVHRALTAAGWLDAGRGESSGSYHGYRGAGRDRIDWILVPPPLRASSHRVLVQEGPLYPSDHHPVVAEVTP
jgi:endonuclease/exonuclease/phosphatase family metal-dependent hydrolase